MKNSSSQTYRIISSDRINSAVVKGGTCRYVLNLVKVFLLLPTAPKFRSYANTVDKKANEVGAKLDESLAGDWVCKWLPLNLGGYE